MSKVDGTSELSERIELLKIAREVLVSPKLHPELIAALDLGNYTPEVHTQVFAIDLKPYASIYLSEVATLGGEARDVAAGYYRAIGLPVPQEPDALFTMFEHYQGLIETLESSKDDLILERVRHLRSAFLFEHLLAWVPFYLTALSESYDHFGLFSEALLEFLRDEVEELELDVIGRLPIVLRDRRFFGDEGLNIEAKSRVSLLVSPFSSGLILSQNDMFRCARETDAVTRPGTKSFMLENLLGDRPKEVLQWLVCECERQEQLWSELASDFGEISHSWLKAVQSTKSYLEGLHLVL